VASNAAICQILPDKSSLKIQVYSAYDLPLPADVSFQLDNKTYTAKITNRLTYQDATTQNFTYEILSPVYSSGQVVNMAEIFSEGKVIDVNIMTKNEGAEAAEIRIPLNYVSNTINGYAVKVKNGEKTAKRSIVL